MQKIASLLIIVVLLGFTTLSYAKSENSNNSNDNGKSGSNSKSQNKDQGSQNPNSDNSNPTPSASPASDPKQTCDPNAGWKNHGEYVSCVAKLKLGGQAVSEAARSDVGKKKSGTPSASLSPSPSSTASATPTASGSASPTASGSAVPSLNIIQNQAKNIVNSLKHILDQFIALFSL